mmetsp:Transcript_19787/g.44069  ORF Transcript_19787/g.44069 Transcript_19787/m.44069 type:complete len:184 (+) Transcript_19787:410-961(+)
MRYGPDDFNYTFVRIEEDEAAAADVEAGLKNEPEDERQPTQPEKPSDSATSATPTKQKSTAADDPLRRSSRAADESTKPYVYVPPKKYGLGGGRGGDGLSDADRPHRWFRCVLLLHLGRPRRCGWHHAGLRKVQPPRRIGGVGVRPGPGAGGRHCADFGGGRLPSGLLLVLLWLCGCLRLSTR